MLPKFLRFAGSNFAGYNLMAAWIIACLHMETSVVSNLEHYKKYQQPWAGLLLVISFYDAHC